MKNACIAGVFLHPDRRKTSVTKPCRTAHPHPPFPCRTRFFCRKQTAADTGHPTSGCFMHKPADRQPATAAVWKKAEKVKRCIAIRNTNRRPSGDRCPVLTAIRPLRIANSPNRLYRKRTDGFFISGMRECGDTRHEKPENRRRKNRILNARNGFQTAFASECCFLF